MTLNDKKIIVTGGAKGIGAATVRAYAEQGARVAILDVLDDQARQLADDLQKADGDVAFFHCDVARRDQVDTAFDRAVERMGGLDVMANIAGVERFSPAEAIDDEQWDFLFDINVRGTMLTNQAAFRFMRDRGGRIMNFGSDAALVPYPNGAHYSASKGAVTSWTRTIASEWGRYGITANTLVPAMWTPMYDDHRAPMGAEELASHDAMMAGLVPLGGKLGNPETDFAPVMVFLAGEGARFITGQIISVNGGLNSVR